MLPFAQWLPRQRWFSAAGSVAAIEVAATTPVQQDLDHVLLDVSYDDGEPEQYQVFVGWNVDASRAVPRAAIIGTDGNRIAYDALYDPSTGRHLIALVATGSTIGTLRFSSEPRWRPTVPRAHCRLVEGGHDYTRLVCGGVVVRIYRRLTSGLHPSILLGRALSQSGCRHVPPVLGVVERWVSRESPVTLAGLTECIENSVEGWDMVAASLRDFDAGDGMHARDLGGDFSAESSRLGRAVATVHQALADTFTADSSTTIVPAQAMIKRLDAAVHVVSELADDAPSIAAVYRAADDGHALPAQRIHGSLDLGRVLRTPQAWILTEFDGVGTDRMSDRHAADTPLRDVASMLFSFEHAPHRPAMAKWARTSVEIRVNDWVDLNRDAFCDGYAKAAVTDPRDHFHALRAFELDRAVWETMKVARHRSWLLPASLRIITRLLGAHAQG